MKDDQRKKAARLEQMAPVLARFFQPRQLRTARDAVEVGSALMLLKHTVAHGEWLPRLEQLGVPPSAAQRLMGCAYRFHKRPDAFFEAVGSAYKLFELLSLEDEEIDALCDGTGLAGVVLGDLEAMTVREVRAAVRRRHAEPVAAPEQRTLQLVQRLRPAPGVEDATIVRSDCGDLDSDAPQLSVAEEVLLRHWRRCDKQGRRAISDVACAMSVATLRATR